MSREIDQKIVEMQFDNAQFERNVSTSMSTLDSLKKSLNLTGATKGLENIGEATKKINMSMLSDAVQTVQAKFSALEIIGITALANITNSAIRTGKRIVSSLTIDPIKTGLSEYETQINAVQTILANTESKGTTLGQVNKALDELNTYADKTIYNFTEMTRNIGTFTAAGVDLKTSTAAIKGIANLAAVSGSTSQQASTAMYQLSQALSSGTVKLMDWNSVVNAGMGGQVFQDSLKETARLHKINIDDMIKRDGSFRETLKNGWLSSQILTETLQKFTGDLTDAQLKQLGYTDKQVKAILKLGQTANDAATKVKTFTQLYDTLKEAAQSGWSQSWKIMVGDFEEAKKLWTEVSNVIGKIIGDSADARNNLLSGGLSSGWDQFIKQGVADEEGYIDAIKAVAKANNINVDEMIDKEGSFEATLKQGWLTSDILSKSLTNLADKTRGLSDKQLAEIGYTREQVKTLESLDESIQNGTISIDDFSKKMAKKSGRENIIDAVKNSFYAVIKVFSTVKEAYRDIFPPYTADKLYALTETLKAFSAKLTLSETATNNLKRTFKGLFAILDIIKQAFSSIFNAIKPLFGEVESLGGGILGVTAIIGDWLVKVRDTIKESNIFSKVLTGVVTVIKYIYDVIKNFVKIIAEKISFTGFEAFHTFLERVQDRLSQLVQAATNTKDGVMKPINALGEALKASKFMQVLEAIWTLVKIIAKGISTAIGSLANNIINKLGNADFQGVLDIINSLISAGIGVGLTKFINNISGMLSGFKETSEHISGIFDGVRGSIEAFQNGIKAKTLMTIALSIGILAVSLLTLSLIDSDRLALSLGAITLLFTDLTVAMILLSKMTSPAKDVIKSNSALITMSISILILASALKKLSGLNLKQLTIGLSGIAALTAMMVLVSKAVSTNGAKTLKGASQLVIFAGAISILASACKKIGALSTDQLIKGLIGVGSLIAGIAVLINVIPNDKKLFSSGMALIAMGTAMKIFGSAITSLSQLSWEELIKGVIGFGGVVTIMMMSLQSMPDTNSIVAKGIALIAIGAAMKIFASVFATIGSLNVKEITKGIVGLGSVVLLLMMALDAIPKDIQNHMIGVGVGLIAVSTAMILLAKAFSSFANLSLAQIGTGILAMGGALVILAIGLNAMKGTLGGSAAMLVATTSLLALVPVLSILGAMKLTSILKGLLAIAGSIAILGAAGMLLGPAIVPLLGLGAALALIGVSMIGLGIGITALSAGLTALAASGVAGATLIVSAVNIILEGIIGLIPSIIEKVGEGLVRLCKVISTNASTIKDAFVAIVKSLVASLKETIPVVLDLIIILLVDLLKLLADNVPSMVDSGYKLLKGFLSGLRDNVKDLATVAIEIVTEFIDAIALKIPDVMDSAADLVISFIDSLADTVETKGPELLIAVAGLAKGIVKGLANGIKGSAKMLWDAMFGAGEEVKDGISESLDMHSPSKDMEEKGEFTVAGLVKGISNGTSKIKEAGTNMGTSIVTSLKNSLGISNTSESPVSNVTKDIIGGGIVNGIATGITENKTAEEAASEKAEKIVNAFKKELDKLDLDESTENLEYQLWEKINTNTSTETEKASAKIATITNRINIKNEKLKLAQAEYDTFKDLDANSEQTQESYNKLLTEQADLVDLLSELSSAQQDLNYIQTYMAAQNSYAFDAYSKYISENEEKLRKQGLSFEQIKKMAEQKSGYNPDLMIGSMSEDVNNAVSTAMGTVQSSYEASADSTLNALVSNFTGTGESYASAIGQGIQNGSTSVMSAIQNMIDTGISKIKEKQSQWIELGSYLVEGFAIGIRESIRKAVSAAEEMTSVSYEAAASAIEVNSPSRKYEELGNYTGLGYIKGVKNVSGEVSDATSDLAISALDNMKVIISGIANTLDSDMDYTPTITPVLDLSNIQNGTNKLHYMLSKSQAVSIGASVNANKANLTSSDNTAATSGAVYTFTQNNYSPKALSRLEIYRQTKNQFSILKGLA